MNGGIPWFRWRSGTSALKEEACRTAGQSWTDTASSLAHRTGRSVCAAERKTITALFADMAGSTALIHDLDQEEARHLIDPVVALMMEAVHH